MNGRHHRAQRSRCLNAAMFILVLLLSGCGASRTIKIGFTAELSGRNATLGVQGRNGAELAVKMINQRGGVAGQMLELLVRDDQASKETLLAADTELIDAGVVALTGHMTSWESVTVRELIEQRGVVLFSPTSSSPELSGSEDHFFRLIPINTLQSVPMAEYAYQTLGARRVAFLHDTDNMTFTQTWSDAFFERFQALGGTQAAEIHYSSAEKPNFKPLVAQARESSPDVLVVVASSMDTALIAQQVRLAGWDIPLMTSNWAYTSDLIQNGGEAVNHILISAHFYSGCQDPDNLDFKARYEETYGQPAMFSAMFAYETIQVLAHALEKTGGKAAGLPEQIAQVRNFKGLCDTISIDHAGDAYRSLFLVSVEAGRFTLVDTIPAAPLP